MSSLINNQTELNFESFKERLDNVIRVLKFINNSTKKNTEQSINNRSDLFKEQLDSKLFFIYDATNSKDLKNAYVIKLYAVRSNGKKISIDLLIGDVFFDIKLNDKELIDEYVDKFEAD